MRKRLCVILFCLLAAGQGVLGADTVVTTSGNRLEGEILKIDDNKVVVDLGATVLTLTRQEVASYSRDTHAASRSGRVTLSELATGLQEPPLGTSDLVAVIEKATPAVVRISNPKGSGAGFFITDEGHIITNYHVIEGEDKNTVTVCLKDSGVRRNVECTEVKIIAINRWLDLALLQVKPEDLRNLGAVAHARLGDTRNLAAGNKVIAIGNPGVVDSPTNRISDLRIVSLTHTTSEGIVSAARRSLKGLVFIQTTAAVNPGNSGGPLLDSSGRVVGVVTLGSEAQQNIGFALPVEYVRHFIANDDAFTVSESNPNQSYRYPDAPRRINVQKTTREKDDTEKKLQKGATK